MSTKHYFPSTSANTLVPRALRALARSNRHLVLDEAERVVASAHPDLSTVSVVGGGGSGHEPAWSGFVGEGLLSAAACGDIFASPSTKQVVAAMGLAPSSRGTILLITNYTGDRLHFGLAVERARALGLGKVAILAATDDVSIGRSKCSRVGRRGMPGHVFTMKILCAAAAEGWSFDRCLSLGQAVNAQTVSIGSALDHCHVPGRQHQSYADDACALGAGIHNEPAQQMISPFPSVEDLVRRMLALLCDPSDAERAFVGFGAGDEVALLVNNYGGLSPLELGALTDEVQTQLASAWGIAPVFALSGVFETSLNAPGFSVSLCNLTAASKQCGDGVSTGELLRFLERETTAVSWPNTTRPSGESSNLHHAGQTPKPEDGTDDETVASSADPIKVDPALLEAAVRSACRRAIDAEPRLTEWDMVMGDGDCGEAVKGLCESVQRHLDAGAASGGSVLGFTKTLMDAVDDMGGTLGAIFGILLSALHAELRDAAASRGLAGAALYSTALKTAVDALQRHTPAREGDRTVMDVLIPFAEAFAASSDLVAATRVAAEKAEGTRFLKPRLGRASYVGEASGQELPDPGAWALYEMVEGMNDVLGKTV